MNRRECRTVEYEVDDILLRDSYFERMMDSDESKFL